jgi:hypothetical protein
MSTTMSRNPMGLSVCYGKNLVLLTATSKHVKLINFLSVASFSIP